MQAPGNVTTITRMLELIEVETGIPGFVRPEQFVPGCFLAGVGGGTPEHGGEGRFGAQRGLVMEFAGDDALDEIGVLRGVGLRQVVREIAGDGELAWRMRAGLLAAAPDPRLLSGDQERTGVGRLGTAARAEEALAGVEGRLAELA